MLQIGCIALLAAALLGCGGSDNGSLQPSHPSDDRMNLGDERPDARRSHAPGMDDDDDDGDENLAVEGLKGHLDPYLVNEGVQKHAQAIDSCYRGKLAGRRYIGGDIEISYVVKRDGTVKSAVVSKSDLGDWDIEKCLRDTAMSMTFAKPKGGEAEFTVPLEFAPTKPGLWWGDDRVATEVGDKLAQLDECAKTAPAPAEAWVTAYVTTRGAITSVGFAAPAGGLSDEWAQCAAGVVQAWTLSDPRGHIAKLSFHVPAE